MTDAAFVQGTNIVAPATHPVKKAVSASKTKGSFPQSHLASFIQSINGSTKGSILLVQELYATYKGVVTQAVLKAKFDEIAVRSGARSGVWGIVDSAWVSETRRTDPTLER